MLISFKHLCIIIYTISIFLVVPTAVKASSNTQQIHNNSWQQLSPSLRVGGSARYRYENKQNFQFSAGASHKVGDEIDITLKHTFPAISSTMYIAYSHFFTGAYITQTGSSKDADFIFTHIKATF